MAYTCVLAPSHECDGCGECEERKQSRDEWLWEKQEEEYDNYKDLEYERYLERSEKEWT